MAKRKFFVTKLALTYAYRRLGSMQAVADTYGVSKKLVLNYMKKFNIDRKRPVNKAKVIKALKDGLTRSEASKLFGVSPERICQIAKRGGFPLPDPFHRGFANHNGYKLILTKDHPFADSKGYVQEHRLVMEKQIGAIISKSMVVHHINGIKDDNRINNLAIMTITAHVRLHRATQKGRGPDKKKRKTNKPPHSCEVCHTETG